MKTRLLVVAFFAFMQTINAQPNYYSWVRNLTGATGYNNIPSNVQSVKYDSSNVYVSCTCIPGYSIGPWNSNPNTPVNQNFVFKITRNPVQNNGTLTAVGLGHSGVWTNGVSVYNVSDGMSYNNAGVWNRNAYFFEGVSFDNCLGHPAPNGEYHHHVNPQCLYDKTDSTHHSPIIGYAFDGFPIYGAYGYTNTNGTGPIKRMQSGYAIANPNATTRVNGPAVNATYPLGCFMEDYAFAGTGDLDLRNGRYCVTPEYPNGIYAYFVTIDAALNPVFPYTMYKNYYGVVQAGNSGPNSGHNTIPGTAVTYSTLITPTISIAASSTSICAGTSVTFTPTITNGGNSPTYQWKKNNVNVATGSSYTTSSLANGDAITCVVTSNAYYLTTNTATSNSVSMNVNPTVTPAVSITASATSICSGANVTFNASATNGGASPSYQWKKNGNNVGSNLSSYADNTLANGDVITCELTSNAACTSVATVTSSGITITVNQNPTPAIGGSSAKCANDPSVAFDAGAGYTSYLWSTGANTQIISVSNAGSYSVTVTNAAGCLATASKSLTVNTNPTPTINASTSSVCPGTAAALSTSSVYTNYVWSTGETSSNISVTIPTTYSVTVTDNNGCNGNASTTISGTSTCGAPTGMNETLLNATSVTLNWSAVSCSYKYQLQYRVKGTTTWTTKNITAPTVTKALTGLVASTTYQWRIRSWCDAGGVYKSSYTANRTFVTAAAFANNNSKLDLSNDELLVYPNPSDKSFHIKLNSEQSSDVIVFDLLGNKVEEQLHVKGELQFGINLLKGTYLLQIISNRKIASKQIIKL